MRPAFSSTKHAAAFAAMMLVLLSLPAVVGKNLMPPREQAYATQSWGSGPYPYIQQQLFEEKGNIDIAFLGSSHILHCLDARRLQDELGKQLGRPATVRVLGWGGAGYDALYFIAKDLLAHRRVRMLVFYDDVNGTYRNAKGPVWFRFQDDARALAGLPLREKGLFYFASLVGMPRNLLCLVRPNLPADLRVKNYWEDHYGSVNLTENLGSTTSELAFTARNNPDADPSIPFIPYQPGNGTTPADCFIYSPLTRTNFEITNEPIPVWQIHFMHLLLALARQQNCQLVQLSIPDLLGNYRAERIEERAFWPEIFGTNLVMLGVPPARVFNRLSDEEVRRLYYNAGHLNKNGQIYFTSLILPSLLQIYHETSLGH